MHWALVLLTRVYIQKYICKMYMYVYVYIYIRIIYIYTAIKTHIFLHIHGGTVFYL